jgi:hypothetical protein
MPRREQRNAEQRKNGNEDDAASHTSTLKGFDLVLRFGAMRWEKLTTIREIRG